MEEMRIFDLHEAGQEAIKEYLAQKSISTGIKDIDDVLDGGVEDGNFYLWLGSSKAGKSTTLRCLGMALSKNFPVLYINMEQLGRNVFGKLYQQAFGVSLREEVQKNPELSFNNVIKMPLHDFYIAFWPDELTSGRAFNSITSVYLKRSIEWMKERDKAHRSPVIIIENLTDIYNERFGGSDNLVNIVTQTAQDIKNFCISERVSIFLAHHTGKLARGQKRPSLDDVRDSKRITDLAHSIFTAFKREEETKDGEVLSTSYHLAYLAGRGAGEYREWDLKINGLEMQLLNKKQDLIKQIL